MVFSGFTMNEVDNVITVPTMVTVVNKLMVSVVTGQYQQTLAK